MTNKKTNLMLYKTSTKYMAAVNDSTGQFRYSLIRKWGKSQKLLFVLLNPSTATAEDDDPTIERCIDYAIKWGYSNLEVVNLFAYRLTDSNRLVDVEGDIIGSENDKYLKKALLRADTVVLAWGEKGKIQNRGKQVLRIITKMLNNKEVYCLRILKGGHPQHPLYVDSMAKPIVYPIDRQINIL